ncbi:MAG: hypothetical protein JWQ27_310 [Ferruginibacter sp.]|nr:hypothetical protein [Ferruginibacter sp.]
MSVKIFSINVLVFCGMLLSGASAQLKWVNADEQFAPLPKGFHVFRTNDSLHGKPFIAYYAMADLHEKQLQFSTDTSRNRRLTPQQFFDKNQQPLLVVNTTFFPTKRTGASTR